MSPTKHLETEIGRLLVALAGTNAGDVRRSALAVNAEARRARVGGATVNPAIQMAAHLADDVFSARCSLVEGTDDREVWSELLTKVDEVLEHHLAQLLASDLTDEVTGA